MAEFPALPLFTDAYLADTMHLSTLQHGAYFLMLLVAWRSKGCCLPDNDNFMAKITRLEKRSWMANKDVLLAFWKRDTAGNFYQAKLKDERNYVEQIRNRNAQAGKASAMKRLNRGSTYVEIPLEQNGNHSATPILSPLPTPIKEGRAASPFFEDLEEAVFDMPDIQETNLITTHPLPLLPLIEQGYNLNTEILPIIAADIAKAKLTGRLQKLSWDTIAQKVVEQRKRNHGTVPEPVNWGERLRGARMLSAWQEDWGPFPNQPGCQVPFQFLTPSDGKGWKIWNPNE